MKHPAGLSSILLIAVCAGCPKSGAPVEVPVDKVSASLEGLSGRCDKGDMSACVAGARGMCKDNVWALTYDSLPPLYVSASGLIRVDYFGMALISTNASEWIACVEECPGSNVRNVCVPMGFDLNFPESPGDNCVLRDREVHPWRGQQSKALMIDCEGGGLEVTHVPSLESVQKALVASHAISPKSPLAKLPGLVVGVNHEGDQLLALEQVSEAHCSVFDTADGYPVVSGEQAFAELRELHPVLDVSFRTASDTLIRNSLEAARKRAVKLVEEQLKSDCEKKGASGTAEIETCIAETERADALYVRLTTRETARATRGLTNKLLDTMRKEYLQPICEKFAGSVSQ